jgi:hypothetical protein
MNKSVVAALRSSLHRNNLRSLQIFRSVNLSIDMHFNAFLLPRFSSHSTVLAMRPRIEIWVASHSSAARFPEEQVFVKRYVPAVFSLSCEKVLNREVSYFVEVIRKRQWINSILIERYPALVSFNPTHWVGSRRSPSHLAESRGGISCHREFSLLCGWIFVFESIYIRVSGVNRFSRSGLAFWIAGQNIRLYVSK